MSSRLLCAQLQLEGQHAAVWSLPPSVPQEVLSKSKSKSLEQKSRRTTERKGQCDKYHLFLSFHAAHHPSMFPPMKVGNAFCQPPPKKCFRAQARWTCALRLPKGVSSKGEIPVPTTSSSAPLHHLCCQRGDSTLWHDAFC